MRDARQALAPYVEAARRSLVEALHNLDQLAASAGVLAETDHTVDADLVTRTEIAARRNVNISTVMSWIDRYDDFPQPVQTDIAHPRWWWPTVRDYLDLKGLPRYHRPEAGTSAEERDNRIRVALRLFPDGLTSYEIADLTGDEEKGNPTPLAVRVRIDDWLRRLEAAGEVARSVRPDTRRGVIIWKLA